MKFSQVVKGTLAEKATAFRHHGTEVAVLLRPLSAFEETEVAAAAIRHAKEKGAEAVDGNPVYDAVYMANVIALSCLDPDSPAATRTPTFDGALQVLKELDTDTIAMLHEQQQIWQEECSPLVKASSVGEIFDMARRIASDADPLALYARLSPRTRLTLLRTSVSLLVESQVLKPPSSSP